MIVYGELGTTEEEVTGAYLRYYTASKWTLMDWEKPQ